MLILQGLMEPAVEVRLKRRGLWANCMCIYTHIRRNVCISI